ncbi:MAG: hypothetical protein ABIO39_00015 [Caulobacteraceae bacterium]
MLKSVATCIARLSLAAACASIGVVEARAAAPAHPDFTGVYGNYSEPGAPRGPRGAGQPELPFTPLAKAKVAEYRALVTPTSTSPGTFCLGTGMPGSMLGSGGYPMEIFQRPEQINVVYEAHNEQRRIYFGSRIMAPDDRVTDRNGFSQAHWEGDVLVVETDNLKEQVDQRYAHSDQAKIVERYHFDKAPDGKQILVAEMTMTDPVFYTQTITATKKWNPIPNGHLLSYECDEETWDKHLAELKKTQSATPAKQASAR